MHTELLEFLSKGHFPYSLCYGISRFKVVFLITQTHTYMRLKTKQFSHAYRFTHTHTHTRTNITYHTHSKRVINHDLLGLWNM